PVLGMRGEELRSTQLDARGVAGDRQHFALGPRGPILHGELPELSNWSAAFPFNPDGSILVGRRPPYPVVTSPADRAYRWGDPRLAHALERSVGAGIRLARDVDAVRGVIVAMVPPEHDPA